MRTNENHRRLSRVARSVLFAAGVLLASAVALSPVTEARDHGDRDHRDSGPSRHSYRFVEVPRRMHGHVRSDFRYAYAGRTYYGPHHHHHAVYRYPVVVGGVIRYRPYVYCNDELFVTGVVPLPRVVLGFNIRPGIHIHAGAY